MNVKPKKKLGQHFLIDQNICRKIVDLLQLEKDSQIVEIGPGTGVLSFLLPADNHAVSLIEIDSESVEFLQQKISHPNIKILEADILNLNWNEHISPDSAFIGNLPYNIGSPILFKIMDHLHLCKIGVFMMQKEVVERICSPHGNKTYGILSVLLSQYFDLKYEFTVSEMVFNPPPKVKSAVFTIRRKEPNKELDFALFKDVVKSAFGQRRKQMTNSLKKFDIQDIPEAAPYLTKRPEQISPDSFCELTLMIDEFRKSQP